VIVTILKLPVPGDPCALAYCARCTKRTLLETVMYRKRHTRVLTESMQKRWCQLAKE